MRILVVKASSLGDIIHCFPVVSYLRRRFPEGRIDWVVESSFADLVESHPDIDHVYRIDSRRWRGSLWRLRTWKEMGVFRRELRRTRYHVVFDLQGNIKSGLVTGMSSAVSKVGFGKSTVPEWPNLLFSRRRYDPPEGGNIREDYLCMIHKHLGTDVEVVVDDGITLAMTEQQQRDVGTILQHRSFQGKTKVMVCPGSRWVNKQWPKESLLVFLRKLQEFLDCSFVFVWGNDNERQLVTDLHGLFPDVSVVVDKLPIPALQNLMAHVDLVVAMDSLPLHLAGTTPTPTVSVFGASSMVKYQPLGDRHFGMQGGCPLGVTFERRCPKLRSCDRGGCIRGLTGEAVFAGFRAWWQQLQGRLQPTQYKEEIPT